MKRFIFLFCSAFIIFNSIAQEKQTNLSEKNLNDTIYRVVDKMPEFPGGFTALKSYIAQNLCYPVVQCSYSGKVYVQFVIDENGKVINPEIIRGVEPVLDKEALRVINALPDWIPGELNGKKVKVWFVIPVSFTLW